MRYSNQIHTAKRKSVLKNHRKSNLITLAWFFVLFAIIAIFVNFTKLNKAELFLGFLASLSRITIAYLIALVIALVLAFFITVNEKVENIFLPIFDVLQSFPSFALFPALIVALKSTEVIIITVLVITIIWPIMFSIISGIKNRREDLEEAATIFGAKGWKKIIHFTLPELAPSIVTGSIVGWGEGWEFIVGAELLVKTNVGIGNYLGFLGATQQNTLLALGILILLFLLFVLNKLLWLPLLTKTTKYQSES
jgi:ABC-type nitrate/sulfonate/bicarbonate transport system permease component